MHPAGCECLVYIGFPTNKHTSDLKKSPYSNSSACISRACIFLCKLVSVVEFVTVILLSVNGEFVEDGNVVQDGTCSGNFLTRWECCFHRLWGNGKGFLPNPICFLHQVPHSDARLTVTPLLNSTRNSNGYEEVAFTGMSRITQQVPSVLSFL